MTQDLEEMLAEGMTIYTEGVRVPDGSVQAARARRRRRTLRRACVAAGGALAVVITSALLIAGGPGSESMQSDAYVVKHVQSALAAASASGGQVMYATTSSAVWGKSASAAYENTGADRLTGLQGSSVQEAQGYAVSGDSAVYTFVNYQDRTWSTQDISLKRGQMPPTTVPVRMQILSGPSCSVPGIPSSLAAISWPAYLERSVACGAFRYRGLVTLNGTRAIMLAGVPSRTLANTAETLWVDPKTYLPIRMVLQQLPQKKGLLQSVLPGSFDPVVTDFQWLPATSANIAMARVAVPNGFRQVRG
jgi:hypothetical protein